MALPLGRQTLTMQQKELLIEIEAQGTPLRIDGQTETYYVLSAPQLRALLGSVEDGPNDVDGETSFTLEDFGLTEADVAAYRKTEQAQLEYVNSKALTPLSTDLSEQLSALSDIQHAEVDEVERDALLSKLEAEMYANLQATALKTN